VVFCSVFSIKPKCLHGKSEEDDHPLGDVLEPRRPEGASDLAARRFSESGGDCRIPKATIVVKAYAGDWRRREKGAIS
jgi:hypothetical protein